MSQEKDVAVPLFSLKSTVSVDFTSTQLLEIALNHLSDLGHEFDRDSVKSSFNTKGMSITVETVEGQAPTKKRATAKKKPAPKKEPVPKVEKTTKEPEPEKEEEPVEAPAEDKGNTPFQAASPDSSDPNQVTIAAVKEEAGVTQNAPFSTDTADIQASSTEEAPAFDFSAVKSQ